MGLAIYPESKLSSIHIKNLPTAKDLDAFTTHVYVLNFAHFLAELPHLVTDITAAELAAAQKFANEILSGRSIITKAYTRRILAHYLNIEPKAVPIIRSNLTKPMLAPPFSPYQFNLAHSKTYFVLALRCNASIGVDIEAIDPNTDYLGISARFFHKEEHADLVNADPSAQNELFFRIWTQKEAWVKTIGMGLSFGLERFCVASDSAKILAIDDSRYRPEDFFSHLVKLEQAHYLCITSTKALAPIQLFQLTP